MELSFPISCKLLMCRPVPFYFFIYCWYLAVSDLSIIIYCLSFQSVFSSLCWIPHIWNHHSRVPFCHVDLALHLSQLRNSGDDVVGGKTRFLPPCNGHSVQLSQPITHRLLSKSVFACIFLRVCKQVEALPAGAALPLFSPVDAYQWGTLVRELPESNRSHGLNPITLNYFCRALCLLEPAMGYFLTKQPVKRHCFRGWGADGGNKEFKE